MSHSSHGLTGPVEVQDFEIEHYRHGNNGIVLKYNKDRDHRGEIVWFIEGRELGVDRTTGMDDVRLRAGAVLSLLVETHNKALEAGYHQGVRRTQRSMREAIGISK